MSESEHQRGLGHIGRGADVLAGTPYRTVRPLGAGGMGELVEAEHVELQRVVAVKLLHQQYATDAKLVDRLRVEARTLAALVHPNVVTVSDFAWTPGGRAYFVMERLTGRNLREELARRGPLPVAEAVGYVRQVLAGLSAAHRKGIVHRDVKAENIFLCAPTGNEPGLIKVLDFGIAKVLRGAGISGAPTPQYPTQEGVLLGTPRSIAPEQALCQPVDARTDIYGAGILLYTLVVGTGPFPHADTQVALLTAQVNETPMRPGAQASQPIPPALDRALLKALEKRPDNRFQTAEEFSAELGRILDSMDQSTLVRAPPEGLASATERTPEPLPRPASLAPPRAIRPSWVFVIALVASTTFFSLMIALVAHFARAPR